MARELEYAIINHGAGDKKMGTVWLEDDKVKSDPPSLVWAIQPMRTAGNFSVDDGRDYMENITTAFRNGYMSCKRVK